MNKRQRKKLVKNKFIVVENWEVKKIKQCKLVTLNCNMKNYNIIEKYNLDLINNYK